MREKSKKKCYFQSTSLSFNILHTVFVNNISKGQNYMKKTYVLDTNVLIQDPLALYKFDDNEVVIPDTVIEELDRLKKREGDIGYNARKTIKEIEHIRKTGDILNGVIINNSGLIRIETDCRDVVLPEGWEMNKPDNDIIRVAKGLKAKGKNVILVSKDSIVRIKATVLNVETEDYENEIVDEEYLIYNGRCDYEIDYTLLQGFYAGKEIKVPLDEQSSFKENEFCLLKSGTATALGRYTNGKIVALKYDSSTPFDISLRNNGQKFAAEALLTSADEAPLVILKGGAGTAKTFLTLACGLQKVIEEKEYRKLLISRANVAFDNDIGALPGDEQDKVGPLLRGCMDNLELLIDKKSVQKGGREDELHDKISEVFQRGYIDAQALGFLRGRSVTNQILLIDEAQNTSPNQMLGIISRAGDGTKIVICGDLDQIDNTKLDRHTNGLAYALQTMVGSPLCWTVGFTEKETVRSKLATEAIKRMVKK